MLETLLKRVQGEAEKYAVDAIERPGKGTSFEYGTHHGYLKALNHVKQWIKELQEEEEDDDNE